MAPAEDDALVGASSDETTLSVILAVLEQDGYTGQFGVADGGQVVCYACHHLTPASELVVERFRRLEGASDPADMLFVAGVRCSRCGHRGALVLGFGSEASPQDLDVMTALSTAGASVIDS